MTYTALEKKIRNLPEDCLEEVSHYVEYLLYRQETGKRKETNLNGYFGSMENLPDGLGLQRKCRDEWD